MTAVLSLTLAAIVRGTSLSGGRRSLGVVGIELLQGCHERVGVESDLLQDQLIPDLMEGWE
jgi:hypothetical protein